MEEAWLERWQEGRIGWHQAEGNASLKKHWRVTGCKVLVPLCGKSQDLLWLADQGNEVIGVELSELAIQSFFAEQMLDYTISGGELPAYRATGRPITIYCGSFFDLHAVRCDAHYDRGALVAVPAESRAAYATHVSSLLANDAEQLVIALQYDQAQASGPPFSVPADELLAYWPGLVCIDEYDDLENAPPKFIEAGLSKMIEKVWRTP
ncbi:MAG: thiopurine S-methyltransferase [Gammaproteobacteria bacterium]|nr:thiopurine S-methyltransferase [Gammaproteobacteria bacterium]MDH3429404.1 thiopurine S-methyltransferase [Gammaproteobacteria bacterium]MDH3434273.1 thiopurine S-methyltransferase [Gammaproteobacteria bacterium]